MSVTLYEGDCLEEMKKIGDGAVDLILCDLPYSTTACKWDVLIPFDKLWEQYKRVLKKGGAVVLTAAQPFTALLVASNLEWFRYELIFEKKRAIGFLYAKKRPLACHENVIVFAEGWTTYNPQMTGGKPFNRGIVKEHNISLLRNGAKIKEHGTRVNDGDRMPRSVVLFNNADLEESPTVHQTQKPIALMDWLVRTYANEGETVLDNCFGSGSTGIACVYAKRKFIGIEKDPEHFATGSARIQAAVEKMDGYIL